MDLDLRVADDVPTRSAAYRLRYEVFVRERRKSPPDADHVGARIHDRLDDRGVTVVAVDRSSGAVVGTARTNFLADGPVADYPALYRLTDLSAAAWSLCSVTTYTAVAPSRRRHGIGTELAITLFELRRQRGMKLDYLDCPNDLVPFFTRLGYRWLRAIRHPWVGPTHLMQLSVQDGDHLAAIRSPFARSRPPVPQKPDNSI